MTTTDTPTTLRVVRREPETVRPYPGQSLPGYWLFGERKNAAIPLEELERDYIDADQHETEQSNKVIKRLIADAEDSLDDSDPADREYRSHLRWFIGRMRDNIFPTTEESR